MRKGITIRLTGPNVDETAKALGTRLVELRTPVERIDAEALDRLRGGSVADRVCHLLARNGVAVIAAYEGAAPEGEVLDVEVSAHDTADFAADKVLDSLHDMGIVNLDDANYSPEEEEQIRQRLADLGYIE